jgi:glycosyltransferase involved in cell wall biosynthesis
MSLSNTKKVIFFTNIVAPYRVSLFNKLEEIRKNHPLFDFEVYFMRKTEADRNWEIKLDSLIFKYLIGKGAYAMIKGFHFHLNPILIFKLIRSKNEIILGSSWNDINVLTIALLKSLGLISNKLSVWSEANYLTINSQKANRLRDRLRSWFFSKIDGSFILPGKMSILSFEKWDIHVKNNLILPNLVSGPLFKREKPYWHDISKSPVLFIVARLEENLKGILNFFEALGPDKLREVNIRIAGTGSSMDDYVNYVKINKLENNIVFLGNLSQPEISKEYINASFFVLPSYSDPSPLAIVEAISSGLPILASDRCGNHFEAIISGQNGYTFDPFDRKDIKEKFDAMMSQKNKWNEFSDKSLQIAKDNFNCDHILSNLIDHFLAC